MKIYPGRINFLLLALSFCTLAHGQSTINRLYGTNATETGKKAFVDADSSIYALGSSSAFTELSSQVYLIKTDKNGNLLWSKFFGGEGVDDATDMYYQTDTAIYITSTSYKGPGKGYDISLIKTDLSGTLIWEKSYGTTDWDIPTRMTRISASAFVVCGYTYGGSEGLADGMFFAFNTDGDSLWFKSTGTTNDEMLYDIVLKNSDTITACGEMITASGKKQGWICEMDIVSQSSVSYHYGTAFNYTFNALELTSGGAYLTGLTTDTATTGNTDIYIWIIDPVNHSVSQQIVNYAPNDEYCSDVMEYGGKYYLLGNTQSYGLGGFDAMVFVYDAAGGWYLDGGTFGTPEDDYGEAMFLNHDSSIGFAGSSPHMFGPRDLWIVNTDYLLDVYATPDNAFDANDVEETTPGDAFFSVYPNPASEVFYIQAKNAVKSVGLYNTAGSLVLAEERPSGAVAVKGLNAGIYLLKVVFEDGSQANGKIVVR